MTDQSDLWGYPVDWSGRFEDEYNYRTNIIVSRSGKESPARFQPAAFSTCNRPDR